MSNTKLYGLLNKKTGNIDAFIGFASRATIRAEKRAKRDKENWTVTRFELSFKEVARGQ